MTFTPRNMIVITGAGAYPRLVVEGAHAAGVARVDVLAVRGSTERATCRAADYVHERELAVDRVRGLAGERRKPRLRLGVEAAAEKRERTDLPREHGALVPLRRPSCATWDGTTWGRPSS